MAIKNILLQLSRNGRAAAATDVAIALASKHAARITALHLSPEVYIPGYVRSAINEEFMAQHRRDVEGAVEAAKMEFLARSQRAGVPAEWRHAETETHDEALLNARYADIVVTGQSEPGKGAANGDLAEELVLAAGRPVVTVPYAGTFKEVGKMVLIAWNATREATLAVHEALPILEKADRVIVYCVNPRDGGHIAGTDIAAHLAQHGVNAEAQHTIASDLEVGDALLSAAADYSADLLVMGAYGHSRFRETVFGGASRHLLRHMTLPVLMAH